MKGLLTDQVSDRLMEAARSAEGVQFLKDMPCEMVFEASKGFVSYQKTASGQLPVFHLTGHVTELRGAFPYGVSSLYFDDDDKQYLFRDCLYYPNPEELTHMIQVGKYFSPQFQIPEVLSHNVYVLPVTVDLTALPPLAETSDGIHTEDSIPVLYVKLTGTGVNEKNDALLRYYGLSVDPDYPSFVLTAESSGYTDPPLMAYIPEPEAPQETQETVVSFSDDYLTPEEEAQMQQEPEASVVEPEDVPGPMTQEDLLLAQADQKIARRMEIHRGKTLLFGQDEPAPVPVDPAVFFTPEEPEPDEDFVDVVSYEPEDDAMEYVSFADDDLIMPEPEETWDAAEEPDVAVSDDPILEEAEEESDMSEDMFKTEDDEPDADEDEKERQKKLRAAKAAAIRDAGERQLEEAAEEQEMPDASDGQTKDVEDTEPSHGRDVPEHIQGIADADAKQAQTEEDEILFT